MRKSSGREKDGSPFDRSFKWLPFEDERALLALFSGIPLDADVEVKTLNPELNVSTPRVDHLCRVRGSDGESIQHFEAISHYRSDCIRKQYWYIHDLAGIYRKPIDSHLILLAKQGVPRRVPVCDEVKIRGFHGKADFRVVKLWEMPAREALALRRDPVHPWVALMDATLEEELVASDRLEAANRDDLLVQMAMLSGLRWGQKKYQERIDMLRLKKEIIRESQFYKIACAEGRQEGRQEGERIFLRRALTRRFESIPAWAEERIRGANEEQLGIWVDRMFSAPTLEAVLIGEAPKPARKLRKSSLKSNDI